MNTKNTQGKKAILKQLSEFVKTLPPITYKANKKEYIPNIKRIMVVGETEHQVNHKRRLWRLWNKHHNMNYINEYFANVVQIANKPEFAPEN